MTRAVTQVVEKAVSGGYHRITTVQPDEMTLDYFATTSPDLVSWVVVPTS